MESVSLLQPQPKVPAELIKFLAKVHSAWHVAIPLLETHVILFPSDARCFHALAELYRLVQEEDLLYGLWKNKCVFIPPCCRIVSKASSTLLCELVAYHLQYYHKESSTLQAHVLAGLLQVLFSLSSVSAIHLCILRLLCLPVGHILPNVASFAFRGQHSSKGGRSTGSVH